MKGNLDLDQQQVLTMAQFARQPEKFLLTQGLGLKRSSNFWCLGFILHPADGINPALPIIRNLP